MPEDEPQNQTSVLNTTYELTNESPFLRIQNFGFMRILCRKCRSPGGRGGVIDQQSLILDNGMKKLGQDMDIVSLLKQINLLKVQVDQQNEE